MEKEAFYEKLKKLKPVVKAYFDAKKIADTPESLYVLEKCGASKPIFNTDMIKPEEVNSLKSTQKAIAIILGLAMVWGVVCVIIGIANLSGMDIVLGAGICVGVFFLYRYLNGKFRERLCVAQEQQAKVDEYNEQIEKIKVEHRAVVETLEAKYEAMKARFEELDLSSALHYVHSYESFSEMLSYAKKHPNQTTASSYLKEVREQLKQRKTFLYTQSQFDQDSSRYSDSDNNYISDLSYVLEHDREERFRHDLERQRREEEARANKRRAEERRAWDEKKKQEA